MDIRACQGTVTLLDALPATSMVTWKTQWWLRILLLAGRALEKVLGAILYILVHVFWNPAGHAVRFDIAEVHR